LIFDSQDGGAFFCLREAALKRGSEAGGRRGGRRQARGVRQESRVGVGPQEGGSMEDEAVSTVREAKPPWAKDARC
jgi:hypothetical protein